MDASAPLRFLYHESVHQIEVLLLAPGFISIYCMKSLHSTGVSCMLLSNSCSFVCQKNLNTWGTFLYIDFLVCPLVLIQVCAVYSCAFFVGCAGVTRNTVLLSLQSFFDGITGKTKQQNYLRNNQLSQSQPANLSILLFKRYQKIWLILSHVQYL